MTLTTNDKLFKNFLQEYSLKNHIDKIQGFILQFSH